MGKKIAIKYDELLQELKNHSLHSSKFQKELQLKGEIIKKRENKILNLAKKIYKLTEQVRSLEFDLEHREGDQDILLEKLDEQMKKNKNITMKKDEMLLELENDIKSKEQALQSIKKELLHKDEEKDDLVEILNNQINKNSNIIGELQALRQKYKLQDRLES